MTIGRKIIIYLKRSALMIIPVWLLKIYIENKFDKKKIEIRDKHFSELSNQELFSIIYKNKLWDPNEKMDFNSGPGSHDSRIINPYISSITKFLKSHNLLAANFLLQGAFHMGTHLFFHQ